MLSSLEMTAFCILESMATGRVSIYADDMTGRHGGECEQQCCVCQFRNAWYMISQECSI